MNPQNNKGPTANASSLTLEDRMLSVQVNLRRERDAARREYGLATERLGLLHEEVEGAKKILQERENTLATINQETAALKGQASLADEVKRLKEELDFRHSENVAKRQKLKEMDSAFREGKAKRENTISQLKHVLEKRQKQVHEMEAVGPCETASNELILASELEDESTRMHLAAKWKEIIQIKCAMYENFTKSYKKYIPELAYLIKRYEETFKAATTDGSEEEADPAPAKTD